MKAIEDRYQIVADNRIPLKLSTCIVLLSGIAVYLIGRRHSLMRQNRPTCAYNGGMSLNLHTLDPAEVLPLPDVPESYGARNEEEARILARVKEGLESGPATPVDRTFFERLRSRVSLIVKS